MLLMVPRGASGITMWFRLFGYFAHNKQAEKHRSTKNERKEERKLQNG